MLAYSELGTIAGCQTHIPAPANAERFGLSPRSEDVRFQQSPSDSFAKSSLSKDRFAELFYGGQGSLSSPSPTFLSSPMISIIAI